MASVPSQEFRDGIRGDPRPWLRRASSKTWPSSRRRRAWPRTRRPAAGAAQLLSRDTRVSRIARIEAGIPRCRRCPELRDYCARVAREKRRAFTGWSYWGRPVPGFGDPAARIWILGLAPAAHGANRTGRMFTGDRSGEFLYAALHRAGLANRAASISRDDGMRLSGVYIGAALRCAPPANRPTPGQLAACSSWLEQECEALARWRVLLCLGAIAWDAAVDLLARRGSSLPRPKPRFAHGAHIELG